MKKNTLIKLLCLALVCMLVLPMVVACSGGSSGPMWTVTLDPNGGELPEDAEDEFQVEDEKRIGKLPNPTRTGYTFLGWYDIDDTALEEKITRSFEVEYDMDLIAHWERNTGAGALVMVEFMLAPDETMEGETVRSLEAGDRIGALPVPERDDYKFKNWKDEKGNKVTQTTIVNADMVLTPVWEKIVYCIDGTENHDWATGGGWKVKSEATCTTPEIRERTCAICKIPETTEVGEATGHKYVWNTDIPMQRTGVCSVCDDTVEEKFTDVTLTVMGSKPSITIDAPNGWGTGNGPDLIDNSWYGTTITGNAKPVTITFEFVSNSPIDVIYVAGSGTKSYVVTWYDENGEEISFGMGALTKPVEGTYSHVKAIETNTDKAISKVVIVMENPSIGEDYWSEVRFGLYPEA